METYLLVFARIVTIMAILLFATLFIMGKRPIGEMPVFDFLVLIIMGSVVGADIADPEIEHLPTAFAIIAFSCIQRLVSFFNLRYRKFRKLITFEPTVVLHNGKLVNKNIKRIHYSIDEVLMMFREMNVFDISVIEYGIIEANGKLSVIKKPQYELATLEDMKIPASQSNAAFTVILDGSIQRDNIAYLKFTEADLQTKLKSMGFSDISEVLYASADMSGNINVSSYNEMVVDLFAQGKANGPTG